MIGTMTGYNPYSGMRHHLSPDGDGLGMTITRLQNVSPILDYNQFLRGLGAKHYKGESGDMWHYAHIPIIVMEQLIQKFGPQVVLGDDVDDEVIKWIEREAPYLKTGDFSLA